MKFSSSQNILSCPVSSALFHLIPHPPSPPHPPPVVGPHLIDLGQGLAAPERSVDDLGCGFIEYQVSRASLGRSVGRESACSAGDLGLIPRLGRSPGEGKGYPEEFPQSMGLQSQTRLSDFHSDIVSVDLEVNFIRVGNQSTSHAYVMKPQYNSGHRSSGELPRVATLSKYRHTPMLDPPVDNGTLLDSLHMSSSKLWEMVMYREAWHAAVHGFAKSGTQLSDWPELNWTRLCSGASQVAHMVKNLPAMQVHSLGQKDPLEKRMDTHASILTWRIPWPEEPGGLQSMGSQRVGCDWATTTFSSFSDSAQCSSSFGWF